MQLPRRPKRPNVSLMMEPKSPPFGWAESYHPHVHCIIPGGGVDLNGKCRDINGNGKFLFPVKALSKVFKGKMMQSIQHLMSANGMDLSTELQNKLYSKPWVVYPKPTFDGTQSVIRYLARYASKVAITHHRITSYDEQHVQFRYTDYRHKNKSKVLMLLPQEFTRRFVLHFLPKGFCKIRHFGILSGAWKNRVFPNINIESKSYIETWKELGLDILKCHFCQKEKLIYLDD